MRFFQRSKKIFCDIATSTHKDAVVASALLVLANRFELDNDYKICDELPTTSKEAILQTMSEEMIESMQVFVHINGHKRVLTWNPKGFTNSFIFEARTLAGNASAYLLLGGKPVRMGVECHFYDVHNGSTFECVSPILGGTYQVYPSVKSTLITHPNCPRVAEYGQFTLLPKFEGVGPADSGWVAITSKKVLADEFGSHQRLLKMSRKRMKSYELQALNRELDLHGDLSKYLDHDITSLVEDLGLLMLQLVRAPANIDRMLALTVFCKLRSGKSVLFSSAAVFSDIINDMMGYEQQSDEDELLQKVTDFRDLLSNWDSLKDSALVKKISRVYKFAVAVGVFSVMGIEIDKATIKLCKAEMGLDLFGSSFIITLLDAVALIIQRALMYKKTGEWSTFFHGPTSYGKWYDQCQELRRHFNFIGNLEAQGTNYHEFVSNLAQAIETGKSILRFGDKTSGFELKAIKSLLNEMLMIQANVFTYREAQSSRRPPFSLLVNGGSSVGKSTFSEMLFSYTGKYLGLPTTDDFKYTRNSADDFWSGWNASKWFVLLDDIAFINPNSPVQDRSLMEMIQLINDVPMVPNQAALEDKGKNPIRAKVVIATTNTKHLNAHAHFACPLAVQRRMPFVVSIEPKPEYARTDSPTMLDPSKVPAIVDDWPDFWLIKVERVVDAGDNKAGFVEHKKFSKSAEFLDWVGDTMRIFQEVQLKAGTGCSAMRDFDLCKSCKRVSCVCRIPVRDYHQPILQAREILLPPNEVHGESFVTIEHDANMVYRHRYEPHQNGEYNYMCITTILRDGVQVSKTASPVIVATSTEQAQVQSDMEYADILAAVVSRQASQVQGWCADQISRFASWYIDMYMSSRTVRNFTNSALEWTVVRKLALFAMRGVQGNHYGVYRFCGEIARRAYLTPRWKWALVSIAAASTALAAYGIYSSSRKSEEVETQGLRASVVDTHFTKTESENVWKRDDYETSSFDKTPLNVSYAALERDQLMQLVRRNVARIKSVHNCRAREGNAFCVGGHLWVTNSHTLSADGDLEISLEVEGTKMGASPNVTFKLRQSEIFRQPHQDLAWFQVMCWEVKRDLRQLIRKKSLLGNYRGFYTGFDKLRMKQDVSVAGVMPGEVSLPGLASRMLAWNGKVSTPTVVGDCGMPLVSHKPVAAILGIHVAGNTSGGVWATALDDELVDEAVKHFTTPIIQCGVPTISAPSKQKRLQQLRIYSPLRWLEEGSVQVFGSFDEYKVTSRSRVRPTLLGDAIKEERGWKVDAVAPILKDWRPWRHALVDVTQQQHGAIDSVKLRVCAQAFVDDVLEALTPEALSQMQVLSDEATINGIDGVKFIDKMNFKSSMGEPYCKSKKGFLEGDIGKKRFVPEVQERVNEIMRKYSQGQRACPVFSGQLKDEPRAQKKVDAGKVRVFTGAPADWSFVVRKHLLTIVKVIQENPFVWEASPGCTAQSIEWERYYDFLTHFGVDRMIAGDYGKFDKKMGAIIILEAFWILAQVLKCAGWTDDELIVIHCIGEDTAFAFVNFDGDLIAFFGSNPSGHPLTVIINCLVNALYMRYCFLELCPFKGDNYEKVRMFKKIVHLLTYGDDNTMGVHKKADWFNHSAIQQVLASIGVEYTMADKESTSRPFIHIAEISYLKRRWRWDEDIGAVVCPLEIGSIHKMLTVCVPSETESPEFHMASVMVSAANEWFWYGRETFERERKWLWNLAVKYDLTVELTAKGFPTWEQLVERFWKASEGKTTERLQGCLITHPRTVVPN